jgi:porin
LNKLRLAATLNGDALGAEGLKAHLQIYRTNNETLSGSRTGDIQVASNIEATGATRLFELWVEKSFGDHGGVRVGLMDLNYDFDAIDPAALFIGSSHGIGPDLSTSGLNGPSIFPVSALGVHGQWSPTKAVTLKAAVFDGVAGEPDDPTAFVAARLKASDGLLLISQADLQLPGDGQASVGVWGYTATFDRLDRPGAQQHGYGGVYAYVHGPIPLGPGWAGWVRGGVADGRIDTIANYLGAGLVKSQPLPGRKDDQLGFAIARAGLGAAGRRAGGGLPRAETALEATYKFQVVDNFALQPDVQYIIHPAARPGLSNALVVGLRVIVSFSHPWGADDPDD